MNGRKAFVGLLAAAVFVFTGAAACENNDGNVYSRTPIAGMKVVVKVHVGTAPDRYKEFTVGAAEAAKCDVGAAYPQCLGK